MTDWKVYLPPEIAQKIDRLGYEVFCLSKKLDQKGNRARYDAKWFELYQMMLKPFCRNIIADDPNAKTENQTYHIDENRVPLDVQEAFQMALDESVRLFDPEKSSLTSFMVSRFKARLIDINRTLLVDYSGDDGKNWWTSDNTMEAAGDETDSEACDNEEVLETEEETLKEPETPNKTKRKKAPVSLESMVANPSVSDDVGPIYQPVTDGGFIQLEGEFLVDEIFLAFASDIIELSANLKMKTRVNYYRLFFTSNMTSFLKLRKSRPYFQRRNKIYRALKFEFVDFCMENECETLEQIQDTRLKYLRDIYHEGQYGDERIPVPIDKEIELEYMKRSPSEPNVTQHTLDAQKAFYHQLYKKMREKK